MQLLGTFNPLGVSAWVSEPVPAAHRYSPERVARSSSWEPMWPFGGLLPCPLIPQQCCEGGGSAPATTRPPKFCPQRALNQGPSTSQPSPRLVLTGFESIIMVKLSLRIGKKGEGAGWRCTTWQRLYWGNKMRSSSFRCVFMLFLFVYDSGQKQLPREPFPPKCCIMFIIQSLHLSARRVPPMCLSGHFNLIQPHAVAVKTGFPNVRSRTPAVVLCL